MLDQAHAPPRDSLRLWMQRPPVFYSDPRPRLGTVNDLIETGDIRLFRGERLRSAAVAYASEMEEEQREASRAVNVLVRGGLLLATRFHEAGLPTVVPGPDGRFRPADLERLTEEFATKWPTLRSDPQVFEALPQRLGRLGYSYARWRDLAFERPTIVINCSQERQLVDWRRIMRCAVGVAGRCAPP